MQGQGGSCPATPRPGSGRPDGTPAPSSRANAEADAVDALLGCHSEGDNEDEDPTTPLGAPCDVNFPEGPCL